MSGELGVRHIPGYIQPLFATLEQESEFTYVGIIPWH